MTRMYQNEYLVEYKPNLRGGVCVLSMPGGNRRETHETKKEALKNAKSFGKRFGDSRITVYKKNGEFQKEITFE